MEEQFEGQLWKIGSKIDVYIKKNDNAQILLNPKFNKNDPGRYIVYVFCGVFALLGFVQIFSPNSKNESHPKKKKKKKSKC